MPVDSTKTKIYKDYYYDEVFICVDCGNESIWSAKQQQWWYEVHQAYEGSKAVRCQSCRAHIEAGKEEQKRHMEEMAKKEPHPNEKFFKNT